MLKLGSFGSNNFSACGYIQDTKQGRYDFAIDFDSQKNQ
jgi:hypothetical protein